MKLFNIIIYLLLIAPLAYGQSSNRDSVYTFDSLRQEVVITAQREQRDNFTLPLVVTVFQKTYLGKKASRTVPEILFGTPGIFLQKTNHGGGSPFLRGLTGQQTLLLVDGIRLNNATFRSGPNQYLNTIDPSWINRIEVMESSGSAAYGSDAIGGVINVLTHSLPFTDRTRFHPEVAFKWMSGGMETSGQTAVTASGKHWAVRAGGAFRQFGDLIAGKGLGIESPNAYTQWSAEAKGVFRLNKHLSIVVAYQDLEQKNVPVYHKVKLENFKYNSFDPQRRQLGYARLWGNFEHSFWKKVEFTASRQRSFEVRKNQKNGSPIQVTETDETFTNGLQINVLSHVLRRWNMTTGAEWYADRVGSDKVELSENTGIAVTKRGLYPNNAAMGSWAAYNLHTFTRHRFDLSAGIRYNGFRIAVPDETIGKSSITPHALVGNFGASLKVVRGIRFFANISSAFRAPNIDDMGTLGIVDFRYELPNSNLRPEKSRSLEGGVKIRTPRFSATFLGYYMHLSDLIGRVRTSDSIQGYAVYQKANITNAVIRGATVQFEWLLHHRWTLGGHTTYTYGQNTTATEPLRRIPPINGRVFIEYHPLPMLSLRVESVFAGDQRRLAQGDIDDNRIADSGTPGWQILNIGFYSRLPHITISGELQNITNTAYRMHGSGVDGTGRSLWVRVGVAF
jgi:hemoglobin/transferrin/lactoferrin receptor protein